MCGLVKYEVHSFHQLSQLDNMKVSISYEATNNAAINMQVSK